MLLLVAAALLTVLTVYSSVFICVSVWSAGAVAAVVLLLSCCVLGVFAVLVAAFVDPGFEVAALWQLVAPPPEELGNVPDFVARPGSCFTCNAVKPPRTHHCSVSGRCVFRYDHYCSWIGNTVGQRNHKAFLLALWYFWIVTVVALALHIWRFQAASTTLVFDVGSLVVYSVAGFSVSVQFVSLSYMSVLQTYLLVTGLTQVEYWCCGGTAYACHFRRSLRKNVEAVMGRTWLLWWLPWPLEGEALLLRDFTPSIAPPPGEPVQDAHLDVSESSSLLDAISVSSASVLPTTERTASAFIADAARFSGGAFDWVPTVVPDTSVDFMSLYTVDVSSGALAFVADWSNLGYALPGHCVRVHGDDIFALTFNAPNGTNILSRLDGASGALAAQFVTRQVITTLEWCNATNSLVAVSADAVNIDLATVSFAAPHLRERYRFDIQSIETLGTSCIDSAGVFHTFALGYPDQVMALYRISTRTWNASHVTSPLDPAAMECHGGVIYALNVNSTLGLFQVLRVEPSTGRFSIVASVDSHWDEATGASCMVGNTFFFTMTSSADGDANMLCALDVVSGHMSYTPVASYIQALLPPLQANLFN